jgi:PBP/GOBP family
VFYNKIKKKMKIIIVISALFAISFAFTDEQLKKGQAHVVKCIGETGVAPEAVAKLKSAEFSDDDEKTQCFVLCFVREAELTDAEGNQNKEIIFSKLSNIDKKVIEKAYNSCKDVKGTSSCNKAYNAYKCYRKANLI